MRKCHLIIVTGLLVLIGRTGWTEDVLLVQSTYMNVGRGITTEYTAEGVNLRKWVSDTTFSTAGVSATAYWGTMFGFLGTIGLTSSTDELGLPGIAPFSTTRTVTTTTSGDESETEETVSGESFNGVALSGDVGIGLRVGTDDTAFLLGAGPHVNLIATPGFSSWMLGVGTQANAIVPIGDNLSFAASLRLAYGFLQFGSVPGLDMDDEDKIETTANGAFTWSLSLGIGLPIGG